MGIRKSIFDGYHEHNIYKRLRSKWAEHFNIYPQLPFTKIFDIESLNVNEKEMEFLKKTNIDITICDKEDRPIMCIEFDGLSNGYNKGSEYIQIKKDPLRKKKLQLKLRVASRNEFPFFIISYDEEKNISEHIYLTIIDSIIGQTIAKMNFLEAANKLINQEINIMDSMNECDRSEYLHDIIKSIEIGMELEWDPIARMAAELQAVLFQRNIVLKMSYKPLSKPELPDVDLFDDEGLEKIKKAMADIEWHGYEVTCETLKGKVIETAWVRNFENEWASPMIIVKNIAELLALYEAARINGVIV